MFVLCFYLCILCFGCECMYVWTRVMHCIKNAIYLEEYVAHEKVKKKLAQISFHLSQPHNPSKNQVQLLPHLPLQTLHARLDPRRHLLRPTHPNQTQRTRGRTHHRHRPRLPPQLWNLLCSQRCHWRSLRMEPQSSIHRTVHDGVRDGHCRNERFAGCRGRQEVQYIDVCYEDWGAQNCQGGVFLFIFELYACYIDGCVVEGGDV
mmetsp:Transcript_26431/g.43278  ORF Transcript_26431/g.43278 Transcript_26431/m.43278 type:complete len:205 (-) Transcript_26431:242-856(-)